MNCHVSMLVLTKTPQANQGPALAAANARAVSETTVLNVNTILHRLPPDPQIYSR